MAPFPAMHMRMQAAAKGSSRGQSGRGAPASGHAKGSSAAAKTPMAANDGASRVHAGFPDPLA